LQVHTPALRALAFIGLVEFDHRFAQSDDVQRGGRRHDVVGRIGFATLGQNRIVKP
jgi:hypothetical protein